jgi:hypothetical protein
VGDTLRPRARALDGRGDSTAADFIWSSLDTTLQVIDSLTGKAVGHTAGKTGRLVARSGTLRSAPVTISIVAGADSITAAGPVRDTVVVSAPDSLSDSLQVHAFSGGGAAQGLKVALTIDFPPGGSGLTLVPGDTVQTDASGIAVFQLRLTGARPDSAVVTASARHRSGTPVSGSPVTFVVEFLQ